MRGLLNPHRFRILARCPLDRGGRVSPRPSGLCLTAAAFWLELAQKRRPGLFRFVTRDRAPAAAVHKYLV